jgi:hypothetical protein
MFLIRIPHLSLGVFPGPGQGIRPGTRIPGLGVAPMAINAQQLKFARRAHVSSLPVGVTEVC